MATDPAPTSEAPGPAETPLPGRLRTLLEAVPATNAFYRARFAAAGLNLPPTTLGEFARRVPFTTKAELVADQAAHPPYGTNLTHPLPRYTRCHQTSGTSGAPLRWLDTAADWSALTDDWATVLRAAGVTPGDRVLAAFSFGPFLGFWLAFEAAQRLGCLCLAGGGMSSAQRARVLRDHACTVLCCTPTYALHLAEVARAEGLHPGPGAVRVVVVAGEPGGSLPATRARLAEAWPGARIFDHHGMTETGPVTHEHPGQPGHLVVLEDSFHAEILDPVTGAPVPDGQTGELVLTTLRRPGSPLIRYRTGDLVRPRRFAPLPDGRRGLVLEGGILGRLDDMVIVRGVNVYPAAVEQLIRSVPGTGEYRVTVDRQAALVELAIEIEGPAGCDLALAERLRDSLSLRIPVTRVADGSLPRFELKARRWQVRG